MSVSKWIREEGVRTSKLVMNGVYCNDVAYLVHIGRYIHLQMKYNKITIKNRTNGWGCSK